MSGLSLDDIDRWDAGAIDIRSPVSPARCGTAAPPGIRNTPRFGDNNELRTPGHNMAAVVGGVPSAVIGPPPEPQTIQGPRGPIWNPDYHS
ncbi:hypothetical protein MMUR_58760 [Mycolicibacterium murale]|uniref:Uncharacterized protein n=1 Tax=Mycolicibacterium murale TaxID=182220 RepID=A0A7I9WWK8_9MYCO|nr:hypothetical protein [Mycolicibacterium murale]ANW63142.1 hypothetical protein BCA37_05555 [Mycobacterium sp. djl-10]MCV7185650.1 hypothetical protein [Mycolicibacterium murale]GFG61740.1 hypothetical protein MMUR_58760 [Mycolicibacterium murale]